MTKAQQPRSRNKTISDKDIRYKVRMMEDRIAMAEEECANFNIAKERYKRQLQPALTSTPLASYTVIPGHATFNKWMEEAFSSSKDEKALFGLGVKSFLKINGAVGMTYLNTLQLPKLAGKALARYQGKESTLSKLLQTNWDDVEQTSRKAVGANRKNSENTKSVLQPLTPAEYHKLYNAYRRSMRTRQVLTTLQIITGCAAAGMALSGVGIAASIPLAILSGSLSAVKLLSCTGVEQATKHALTVPHERNQKLLSKASKELQQLCNERNIKSNKAKKDPSQIYCKQKKRHPFAKLKDTPWRIERHLHTAGGFVGACSTVFGATRGAITMAGIALSWMPVVGVVSMAVTTLLNATSMRVGSMSEHRIKGEVKEVERNCTKRKRELTGVKEKLGMNDNNERKKGIERLRGESSFSEISSSEISLQRIKDLAHSKKNLNRVVGDDLTLRIGHILSEENEENGVKNKPYLGKKDFLFQKHQSNQKQQAKERRSHRGRNRISSYDREPFNKRINEKKDFLYPIRTHYHQKVSSEGILPKNTLIRPYTSRYHPDCKNKDSNRNRC